MITITSPLHMTRTQKSNLFYSLCNNYLPGTMPLNSEFSKSEFIDELQNRYDCKENLQNAEFLDAAESCNFLSITRQIDNFQINF